MVVRLGGAEHGLEFGHQQLTQQLSREPNQR